MKILFIYSNIEGMNELPYPHGLGSIISCLKKMDHDVSLLFLNEQISRNEFIYKVKEVSPDMIGYSTVTNQWHWIKQYSSWAKDAFPDILSICGGIHPTFAPEEVISSNGIDIVCRGEGEYIMLELIDRIKKGKDIKQINGLWVKDKNGNITKNSMAHFVENLDSLPFSDKDSFNYYEILKAQNFEATIMAGRGCPFECAYCCNYGLQELYASHPYVRKRSIANVMKELEYLNNNFPVNTFHFEDDTFTLNKSWVTDFCREYKKLFNIPFSIYIRPDTEEEIISVLKKSGCYKVHIGIECGNEKFRKKLLSRPITNKQIAKIFYLLEKNNIKTHAFIILGFPGETPGMINESMSLVKELKPDHTQISIFYPYPGTKLFDKCKQEGILTNKTKSSFFAGETTLNLKNISPERLKKYYEDFYELSHQIAAEKSIISDERMTPVPDMPMGEIFYEHINRYNFARQFCINNIVLDLGCGAGYGSKICLDSGAKKVVGIDNSLEVIEYCRKNYRYDNLKFLQADCLKLPFKKDKFDIITCFELIEHVNRLKPFFKEAKRVLKNKGLLVISTPNKKTYLTKNKYHIHEFELKEFKELLSFYFRNVKIFYQSNFFSSNIIDPLGRDKIQNIKIKTKMPLYFIAVCSDEKLPLNIYVKSDFTDYDFVLGGKINKLEQLIENLKQKNAVMKKIENYLDLIINWKIVKILRRIKKFIEFNIKQ